MTEEVHSKKTNEKRLLPISIYDTLIHSGADSVGEIGRVFEKTKLPKPNLRSFLPRLLMNSEFMSTVQRLYAIATKKGAVVIFPDGTEANVFTLDSNYVAGSTLHHLDKGYELSKDFIMNPYAIQGETLNSIMSKFNTTSVYGPITMKILQEIGWSTWISPSATRFVDIESEAYY